MKDLRKINLLQLYLFWKNLSIAMLLLIVLLTVSTWTHSIFTIFTAIICAFIIYARIYANKTSHHPTYMLVGYALMMSIIIFTVILMVLAFLNAWGIMEIHYDFNIFKGPRTLPVLVFAPVCFFTLLIAYIRRKSIHRYLDNHFGVKSDVFMKGKLGVLLTRESRNQVRNLILLFGTLSAINWIYYGFFFYRDAPLNNKDIYIFFWVNLMGLSFYLIYLLVHNYNLDLILKENGELITPEEANNMSPKNYIRCFVICDDKLFVSYECDDPDYQAHKVLDTPFFLSRTGEKVTDEEVKALINLNTGVDNGELRFFFSFQAPGLNRHNVLRYFYFLDGKPEDYPQLGEDKGEWMTLSRIQEINRRRPHGLSSYLLADIGRMITIMHTNKLYDEFGNRRYKIKSYVPTFKLNDLRTAEVDFQSAKWLNIARLNSDKPFFKLRRFFRAMARGGNAFKVWMV